MKDEISIPTDVVVQHAKAMALEIGECEEHVPDGCNSWSIKTMDVDHVEYDSDVGPNGAIRVHGHDTGSVSRRVARATRHSPPEYERLDVRVNISITFDLTDQGSLGGIHTVVDAEGDPREPPEPDIDAHRYDL